MHDLYDELDNFPMNDYIRKADRIKLDRKIKRTERIVWFIFIIIIAIGIFALNIGLEMLYDLIF